MKGVVFDFDGVLADSEPLHLVACQEVFAGVGVELTREDYYANYLGYNDEMLFKVAGAASGMELDQPQVEALIVEKARLFDALIAERDVLYPGAEECVERLARDFPLGIASGALRHEIEMILRRAGLDRHIRFIVASGDTPNSKPHPDPYARAAERHGLPPSACVAIEDSRWGIESAKSAGLRCVAVTHTYPASALTTADRVIPSLAHFTADLIRSL